jgi:hypothetical protein
VKKVLVTYRDIPGGHLLETLSESFEVATSPSSAYMSREQLLDAVKDVHGLVSLLSERVDTQWGTTTSTLGLPRQGASW